MIENIIIIVFSIIMPVFILNNTIRDCKKKKKIKNILKENKYELITYFAMVVGFIIRLINLEKMPNGLIPDEASAGYEAFSILNYGTDRLGKSYPVFLISWGSGQNALYTYLLIPFIKILGLTKFAVRLPMAIVSCISIIAMYYLLKNIFNKKIATIGVTFLAICPWHIMKARYGLESNIFPNVVLFAILFMVLGIKKEKMRTFYFGWFLLGLSTYAYGTSCFFVTIFSIITLIFLLVKRKIKLKNAFIAISIAAFVALPIIIMIFINTFDLQEIKIFGFTIPRLFINRFEGNCSIFSSNFITNSINSFITSLKILIIQDENFIWGLTYWYSMPLFLIGAYEAIIKNSKYHLTNQIMNIWFLSAILLLFMVTPGIIRINIIMIPIIYYIILGISIILELYKNKRWRLVVITIIIIASFIGFIYNYFSTKYTGAEFVDGVQDVIKYVDSLENKNIYMEYNIKEPYIYVLFYARKNPKDFYSTVTYFEDVRVQEFENIKHFDKYYFYIPENIEAKENNAYVISYKTYENLNVDSENYKITYFEKYVVLE